MILILTFSSSSSFSSCCINLRELDKEINSLQTNEKKLVTEIKKNAQKNLMGPVKVMAKDLVRTR